MNAPQMLVIALFAGYGLLSANKHGKSLTGKYNFWAWAVIAVVEVGLLWWGGFWS